MSWNTKLDTFYESFILCTITKQNLALDTFIASLTIKFESFEDEHPNDVVMHLVLLILFIRNVLIHHLPSHLLTFHNRCLFYPNNVFYLGFWIYYCKKTHIYRFVPGWLNDLVLKLHLWIEDSLTNIFNLEVISKSKPYHVEIWHYTCRIL